MSDDAVLCYCYAVTYEQIRRHFEKPGATVEELIEETDITRKCTACALDLDVLLDDLQATRLGKVSSHAFVEALSGFKVKVDRVDSGFFIQNGRINSSICLANYPPVSGDEKLCTAHTWSLVVFGDDGTVCHRESGRIGVHEEVNLKFSDMPSCPEQGWFLLSQSPAGEGHYGTLRPQVLLAGDTWGAAYHTQFHSDASRKGRRSGTPLLAIDGKTRSRVSVINSSKNKTSVTVSIDGTKFHAQVRYEIDGNGAWMFDVDELFANNNDGGPMTLRVHSDEPTRKNLINLHPDGSWGVDHFPNLV
jgi:hypothetical protein